MTNRLRLGEVVVAVDDGERGIVVWVAGMPRAGHVPLFADDTYAVRLSAGVHRCGNLPDNWRPVPVEQWTREERVRSAALTWEPSSWYADGDRISDVDTYEWALLWAIYDEPEDELDRPSSLAELAIEVARQADERNELVGSAFLGATE